MSARISRTTKEGEEMVGCFMTLHLGLMIIYKPNLRLLVTPPVANRCPGVKTHIMTQNILETP